MIRLFLPTFSFILSFLTWRLNCRPMILPGFLALNIVSITADTVAVVLNIGLIYLMQSRPTQLDPKTVKLAAIFSVLSIIFGISHALTQPIFFAFKGLGVSFCGSFLHGSWISADIVSYVISPCYMAMLMCGAVNFLYKYAVTCSPSLRHRFGSPVFIISLCSLGTVWITIYTVSGKIYGTPNESFREKVAITLNDYFHTDFRQVPFSGVESETYAGDQSFGIILVTLNYFSIIFSCLGTMIVCGWRIHRMISRNKMSERVRRLHKQALRLLILQTINPIVFAVFPAIIPVMYLQSGKDFPESATWTNAYVLFAFPLLNPIIFVICTKEYRNWILNAIVRHSHVNAMANIHFSVGPSMTQTISAPKLMLILPGFEVLNVVCIFGDCLSVLLNSGLIVMLRNHGTSLDRKTVKFAIAFAILSVIFAIVHCLIQPFTLIFDGVAGSFSASFMHDSPVTQYIMTYALSPCYIALLECGAFNFLYKYAATCSKSLYHRFDNPIFVGSLSSIGAIWLLLYTYFGAYFKPTMKLRNKQQAQGLGPLLAMINFMSLVSCCIGTILWCGWRIQHMIASNKLSERAKKLHRKALRLLVLQTSNPLFFCVVPGMVPAFVVQSRATLPEWFSWFNAYGLLLFPLLNPIIFVICTKDFRKFTIAFSFLSIIFAFFHAFIQPFTVIFDGIGMSFAASFLHDIPIVGYIQTYGMSPCYMALLECGAFNFLYKYAATCNKALFLRFDDQLFVGALSSVAATWLLLYTYFGAFFKPTPALREKVAVALNDRFQADFRDPNVCITGIDSEEHGDENAQGFMPLIAMLNFMTLITFCLGTILWCGWRIQRMIARNKMSERVRKLHRQALRLLVLQTANPLFFAVVPAIAPVFFIQAKVTLPDAWSWFNAYGLLFFPLLNPIVFVICTKEFRNWILSQLITGHPVSKPPILPGFENLNYVSITVDFLSIMLNIGLIQRLRTRHTSLDRKTVKFTIAFGVLSIIFAFFHALIQPFEVIFDGVGLSFPASFLHDSSVVGYIQGYGMSPCYMALLECGAFHFLYKYAATCNKALYNRFDDRVFVGSLSSIAALNLLLYTFFGAFFRPSPAFREKESSEALGSVIAMVNFLTLVTGCLGHKALQLNVLSSMALLQPKFKCFFMHNSLVRLAYSEDDRDE
ncbi:hypothetical protein PRIPAC_94423 [Pristionchus pacificus]|uniref:G protein-coupled receptor n=1 Tax=Pristionchus pacificus TaxID=54126 RepID=A0A2A6BQ72_PRIPA|nr:hypothetical protein PRIPAC_94423 [Pristionchus pacificus]|eukprot:PDM68045.1 G protein-coupled receptor [Pristionchus pacificus]